uniref:ELMO domain-containing protein n=1 Tax=Amazona collaria TaxID=241587 RepID=A0A8B9F4W7_9PSIT
MDVSPAGHIPWVWSGVEGLEVVWAHRHAGIPIPLLLLQEFPFGIMSVNITRIVLQALREERLSRECNRRQQVIAVLNDLYAAAFLRLYRTWKGQHKTIADSCFLLKELELSTKRKPKQLLKSLEAFVSRGPTAEGPAPPSPPSPSSRELSFTGLCDLEDELWLV